MNAAFARQLAKEFRALLPAWLAGVAATIASLFEVQYLSSLVVPVCLVAVASIGALAIGHEYTSRTLPVLLVQPVRRGRVLLLKLIAAATLVISLTLLTWLSTPRLAPPMSVIIGSTALLAIVLAPWLTMICRSAIGGAVFTITIPGLLLLASDVVASWRFGPSSDYPLLHDAFRLAALQWGTLLIAAAGAILTWRTFARLEAVDGSVINERASSSEYIRRVSATADAMTKRRHPVWLLLQKELHLQQLPVAVAGLYLLGRAATGLMRAGPDAGAATMQVTLMYSAMIAMLVGALASAEERQLGVLEWQTLLPVPFWHQWSVKAAVVIALAVLLGIVLPVVLFLALPMPNAGRPEAVHILAGGATIVAVLAIAVGSLYVSTLCSSGLRALVVSVPVYIAVWLFLITVAVPVGVGAYDLAVAARLPAWAYLTAMRAAPMQRLVELLLSGLLALALRFAFVNQQTADRPLGRIALQVAGMAGAAVAMSAVLGVVGALFWRVAAR